MAERIVKFAAAHIGPCAKLFRAVFNAPPWSNKWTPHNAREHLREILKTAGFIGFVMLQEKTPVAFAVGSMEHWSEWRVCYLKEMCVRADLQRQGVGSRLLRHFEAALRRRGIHGLYLMTLKDVPAAEFYRKHKYRTHEAMVMMYHPLQ